MLDFFKNNTIALVLAVIGGVSGYFQGVGAAKEDTAKKVDLVEQKNDLRNEEQDKDITELKSDFKELTKNVTQDVKKAVQTGIEQGVTEALRTSKVGDNTPALGKDDDTVGFSKLPTTTHE